MPGDKQSEKIDRPGDKKISDLTRVIDNASRSGMDEVLDAWGAPPARTWTQEKSRDFELEYHGEHGEKLLLKSGIEEKHEKPVESLNTDQIGMMALSGHPVAQAGAEMLKTPAAQNKEIRDGIKRDISNVLGDWFKETFQNATNVLTGFDKWVTSAFNVKNLREFGEGIRKAAFNHTDKKQEPVKITGDMQNFHLKGVESPQDLAEYGVSTAVGVTKAISKASPLLTPEGFSKANHDMAESGRDAIKNAAEYYGEHGVSKLPADTVDATRVAYDRLGQWSADRMQMEPSQRGELTGTAMSVVFLLASSKEFLDENSLARRMGIGVDDVANMTDEELVSRGVQRRRVKERDYGQEKELPAEIQKRAFENPSELVQERTRELASMIPADKQGRVTMSVAVAEDAAGKRHLLIGTSEEAGYLRGSIKPRSGEKVIAGGKKIHAEEDIAAFATQNKLRLVDLAATRPICPDCVKVLKPTGTNISSELKE